MGAPQPYADTHIVVWLRVEQSAHRRHQLAVTKQSVTTDSQQHDVNIKPTCSHHVVGYR